MPSLHLELHVGPDDLLDYYRGEERTVHARATNGQTVNFPATAIQRFVTAQGVHGWRHLEFDGHHKFVRLERCASPTGFDRSA